MGRLLVVATPIGNLEDLSPRALEALSSAAVVYCEDTRRTGNLFARHGLTSPRREGDRWYAAYAMTASRPGTAVLFESPFRIVESLEALARAWGDPPVVLGRELTKLHEEVLRGRASEIAQVLAARPSVKGEIVLAAAPSRE